MIKFLIPLLLIPSTMHAQQSFESYINKIYFNVFLNFSNLNYEGSFLNAVPNSLKENSEQPISTIVKNEIIGNYIITKYSYHFDKHLSFNGNFFSGQLNIYEKYFLNASSEAAKDISNVEVIFTFKKFTDANKFFQNLKVNLLQFGKEPESYPNPSDLYFVVYSPEISKSIPARFKIHCDENNDSSCYNVKITIN